MNSMAILKILLSLASSVAQYMQNKQLLEAGKAQAILQGIKDAREITKTANAARSDAVAKFDERAGLPDESDPNLRD